MSLLAVKLTKKNLELVVVCCLADKNTWEMVVVSCQANRKIWEMVNAC